MEGKGVYPRLPVRSQLMSCCTEGRRLLLALLQTLTRKAVALRLGVSRACVSYWASGDSTPERDNAQKLQEQFGIPIPAWSQPAQRAKGDEPTTPSEPATGPK